MKNRLLALIPFCFLVLIIGLHFDLAPAAPIPAPSNEIEITKTDSANKGEATGEGNVKLKTGWDVKKNTAGNYLIIMHVYDKDDKEVKSVFADYASATKTWKGLVISLTSGQTYKLQAYATFTNGVIEELKNTDKMNVTIK